MSTGSEAPNAFMSFYKELLGKSGSTRAIESTIIDRGKVLNKEQQYLLSLSFIPEQIKEALFSIPDDKSPGIDGY